MHKRRSIATRITWMNLLVTAAALLLAAAGFLAYDQVTVRQNLVRTLSAQAEIVGRNSVSAIVFSDAEAAAETLSALRGFPHIEAAAIFTPDGQVFAQYRRDETLAPAPMLGLSSGEAERYVFAPGEVVLQRAIVFQENATGFVSIRADLRELRQRLNQYLLIVAAVLGLSFIAALLVSAGFRRALAQPIAELAETARRISREQNYSIRAAPAQSAEELAVLTTAFNEMLEQIQNRDAALQEEREKQMRAQAALLQSEKLAAAGRLAASISHEINNPLESVTNLLYLIATDPALPASSRQYALQAEQELARVSHIATQTLRFYRQTSSPTLADVSSLLESVLGLLRGRLASSEVEVVRDYGAPEPLLCREGELRQVFTNLVNNALDAMAGRKGRLTLRTRAAKSGGKPGVRITIADTGAGIASHSRERIFEAFFSTKGHHGTGLGLWVTRDIVQRHGGRISVRSQPGRGTVFSIIVPQLNTAASEAAESPSFSERSA